MAAALAFNAADPYNACMIRLGFNQATVQYLRSEDIDSAEALKSIALTAMDRVYKNVNKSDNFPAPALRAQAPVKLSYLNWIKVIGLRAWIDFRSARNQPLDLDEFDGEELIQKWIKRAEDVVAFNLANRPEGTLPPDLTSDWRSFEELFRTYLHPFLRYASLVCNPGYRRPNSGNARRRLSDDR